MSESKGFKGSQIDRSQQYNTVPKKNPVAIGMYKQECYMQITSNVSTLYSYGKASSVVLYSILDTALQKRNGQIVKGAEEGNKNHLRFRECDIWKKTGIIESQKEKIEEEFDNQVKKTIFVETLLSFYKGQGKKKWAQGLLRLDIRKKCLFVRVVKY